MNRRSAAPRLVTIGIPVRNGERFLSRALDSLLAQTYPSLEIRVFDNASTDRTAEILAQYAARDRRLVVHRHAAPIGAVANFLSALEGSQGDYFMWAADDDLWRPEFVNELVTELESHPAAGVAMSAVALVTEDDRPLRIVRFKSTDGPNGTSHLRLIRGATSLAKFNFYIYGLYRTDVIKRAALTFSNVPGSDRLLVCQLALGTLFRYVDRVLHVRTVRHIPLQVRLPNERFTLMQSDPLVDLRVLTALAAGVMRSSLVPARRKLYLPYLLWRYARLLTIVRVGALAKRHLPADMWDRIRRRAFGGVAQDPADGR